MKKSTVMQPQNHKIGKRELTAVYYIHQFNQEKTLNKMREVLGDVDDFFGFHYFSSYGTLLTATENYSECAHYLAPLDQRFKCALMLDGAVPLPPSRSLCVLLGTMLRDMGQGAEIFFQVKATSTRSMVLSVLKDYLPSSELFTLNITKGWIRVAWGEALEDDLMALKSIYPSISKQKSNFFKNFSRIGVDGNSSFSEPQIINSRLVENAFCYSMHWALHTMAILEKQLPEPHVNISGIDVGGAYGFLACELAARGYLVKNLEADYWKVKKVFPWLSTFCGVADRVTGLHLPMQKFDDEEQSFDFILFMGSLLNLDREDVPIVLNKAEKMLKPGGVLVLRENLLTDENKFIYGEIVSSVFFDELGLPTEYYLTCFTAKELNSFLKENFATPKYYCHRGIVRKFREIENFGTVFAALKKRPFRLSKNNFLRDIIKIISRWISK